MDQQQVLLNPKAQDTTQWQNNKVYPRMAAFMV